MSITGSFYRGLSGLNTHGTAMGIIGDNIANVNTTGFKSSSAQFQDVLGVSLSGVAGGNQTGAGTNIQTVDTNFVQATFSTTEVATDVAVNGRGFFVVKDPTTSEKFYTRAGHFHFDNEGYYVNTMGERVQGYLYDSTGTQLIESLADIQISQNAMIPPNVTTQADIVLNLDTSNTIYTGPVKTVSLNAGGINYVAGNTLTIVQPGGALGTVTVTSVDAVTGAVTGINPIPANAGTGYKIETGLTTTGGAGTGCTIDIANVTWDITDPDAASNYSTPVKIYDTLGQSHILQVYFTKTAANTWQWHAAMADSEVSSGGGAESYRLFGSGEVADDLEFSGTTGNLTSPTTAVDLYDAANAIVFANGALATAMTVDFTGTTQYGAESVIQSVVQDGYSAGTTSAVSIDDVGNIVANFTNGQVKNVARFALSSFLNINGLLRKGDTLFSETISSGQAITNKAGEGGMGGISSSMLEESNVDLAGEIIKMIVIQRGFQANSKVISTTDEMLNTLIQLR